MLSHRDIRACVLAAWALGGCVPTTACPDGQLWDGTACVPESEACGAGRRWDGSMCVALDGGLDGGSDGGSDAGPCGVCSGATPLCDAATGACVACLEASDCAAPDRACVEGACVGCDDAADCSEASASRCDGASNACAGCLSDADCTHLTGTPVCDEASATCAACTPDTEASACGPDSCDPATLTCTDTPRASVLSCGACRSDSECRNPNERCVPMRFGGMDREGGYCLRELDAGCMRPFGTPTEARESLSGAPAEVYCGLDEATTTCEALGALLDGTDCSADEDCGAAGLMDGRCETVNFVANRCTYSCIAASGCPEGFMCPARPDTYCGAT